MAELERLYDDLRRRASSYGIAVREARLDPDVPGEFDGLTVTLNDDYDAAERAFYLAHSVGSIAEWSLHPERSGRVFAELQRAKRRREPDPARLDQALTDYAAFETRTWEFAVWLLHDLGHDRFVEAFTNFGRADLEAMLIFHRTGEAPVWKDFFARWNKEVRSGARPVAPFAPRPIPEFQPAKIPKQEIVQEDDET